MSHIAPMSEENETQFVPEGSVSGAGTIAVTGASGFVGSVVVKRLQGEGRRVIRLVRDSSRVNKDSLFWNPLSSDCDLSALSGIDAVVHLAGESILGVWTPAKRRRIYESRVSGARNLTKALEALRKPPRTLICASAVGFYGSRGDEKLNESNSAGSGFLASTCQQWESAAEPAREAGIRVVHLRIGVVLDPAGGAFRKAVSAFRLGLGGRFGSGEQYMSWITREDLARVICFALEHDSVSGALNAVAPTPLTNSEYTEKLSAALRRPAFLTAPAFLLRLLPGGMAPEMLLASVRAIPAQLLSAGFEFSHPDIDTALTEFLSKPELSIKD